MTVGITERTPVLDMTVGITEGSAGRRRLSTELDRNKCIVVEIFIHIFCSLLINLLLLCCNLNNISNISLLSLHYITEQMILLYDA
jgi:hypothetical protein